MTSDLDQLAATAFELVAAAGGSGDVAERAGRLAVRLSTQRFHISVLGEFKSGKSTLVNAMVGAEVLPTGALPLTAVATEVSYGPPGAVVVYLDGRRESIPVEDLAGFVTEARNPGNVLQVSRAEVTVPASLLESGVVLVDTPGLGSLYLHNDEEARRALLEADGAMLVLSADAPMSANERDLLAVLASRRSPTFFVLNKVDHLGSDDADQVRRFVADAIAAELGRKEPLWCLSARTPNLERGDFAAFEAALGSFVRDDLVKARLVTARRELARLGRAVEESISVEEAAYALDAEELAQRVEEFRSTAERERRTFADERTLLARDVGRIIDDVAERLATFAARAPADWSERLDLLAAAGSQRRLEDELRNTVERAVQESFDEFRQVEAERVEGLWVELAERLRKRTEDRINTVRKSASDIFDVSLPQASVPSLTSEPEQFFYLFVRVEPMGDELLRWLRFLLPAKLRRRRLVRLAREQLAREFDKHAGRARWDLSQRLEALRRSFEQAMGEELDSSVSSILEAAGRAERLAGASAADRDRYRRQAQSARDAAHRACSLDDREEA